jgi:sulfonate transport system permease protein
MNPVIRCIRPVAFPFALLAALEWWARTVGRGSDAVAPPSAALMALAGAAGDGTLWQATAFTLTSAALGLLMAGVLGVLCGTLLGLSPRISRWTFLSVEVLRPVPSVALIPLSLLVFGFGLRMELAVIAFACFWPMLVLAQAAARQVEPQLLEVAQSLELSALQRYQSIILPAMLPRLFVALRLGVAIALVVAVTVEIAANPHGMGYALVIAQQSLDPALMMAWLIWIGCIGFIVNNLALRLQAWVAQQMGATEATGRSHA